MMDDAAIARLQSYTIDSNEALEFKLVRKEQDVEDPECAFSPEMSHQVFGDSETIFGYKDLKVKLYYSAGCLETFLGMSYSEKVPDGLYEGVKADDILPKISEVLAPAVHDNVDSFIKALSKDENFKPFGELLHSYSLEDEGCTRQFEIYKANMTHKGFKEYHQRLQTFLLWYIDAASFIDIDDDQWHYFNMYEKYSISGEVRYATVGFATCYEYYAYPNNTRPRIAQILILPPFQRLGLGAQLLKGIYQQYLNKKEVRDITVENASVDFQCVRDYVDAVNCATLPSFTRNSLNEGFNKSMANEAREKLKINRKQARRVYEILRLQATDLSNEEEYRNYRLEVKKRLNSPYKREQLDQKKVEAAVKKLDKSGNVIHPSTEQRIQVLDKEYRLLEEDYKRVIKRLEASSEQ